MTSKPAQVDGDRVPRTFDSHTWCLASAHREDLARIELHFRNCAKGGLLFGEPLHHGSLVIAAPARRRLLLDAPVEQLTARLERAGPGNRHQVLEPNALASALDAALVMAFSWPSEARFEQVVAR